MKRYPLVNSFHRTKTWTRYAPEEREDINSRAYEGRATAAELRARNRAWNKLCGFYGSSYKERCKCGNGWGERP